MAIDIKRLLTAIDNKDRDFYDNLSDEDKKAFSPYMMIRWSSTIGRNGEVADYYLMASNERLNKNFFSIPAGHDKLHWLTTTTVSPGMGTQWHEWLAGPKRQKANSKVEKFFAARYPDMKPSDVALMATVNDLKAVKAYAKDMGMTPEQIKKELG